MQSVASDPVRGDILNGLLAGTVGRGGKPSLSLGRSTGTVSSSVVSACIPLSPVAVFTFLHQAKHRIVATLRIFWLAVPHLALMLTTRRLMHMRMLLLQTGMLMNTQAL